MFHLARMAISVAAANARVRLTRDPALIVLTISISKFTGNIFVSGDPSVCPSACMFMSVGDQ